MFPAEYIDVAARTPQLSAGLLIHRNTALGVEVLLAHPGGPLWARKDDGAWSIPKGLVEDGEELLVAARREFAEEIGQTAPDGEVIELGEVRLKSGKRVVAFAIDGDLDVSVVTSNTFEMPWPPRSGISASTLRRARTSSSRLVSCVVSVVIATGQSRTCWAQ